MASRRSPSPRPLRSVAAAALGIIVVAGCQSSSRARTDSTDAVTAAQLEAYVGQVEPVRLAVNDLLEGADPILDGYRSHALTPDQARQQMGDLEAAFARQLVAVESIEPDSSALGDLHQPYAHTFVEEDSYLSALAAALPGGTFDELPDTQNDQRQAIVEWRTRIEVLAGRTGAALPDDFQQAGRGEIRPSPTES